MAAAASSNSSRSLPLRKRQQIRRTAGRGSACSYSDMDGPRGNRSSYVEWVLDPPLLRPRYRAMKTKTIGLALLVTMMAGTMCFANPSAGTWKLNESKSKFSGKARTTMVVWDKEGDQERCTVDGTDADGKKTHTVWTGKLDGKDYPVTGDANSNTRSFKLSGDNTLEMVSKQDGKVV